MFALLLRWLSLLLKRFDLCGTFGTNTVTEHLNTFSSYCVSKHRADVRERYRTRPADSGTISLPQPNLVYWEYCLIQGVFQIISVCELDY